MHMTDMLFGNDAVTERRFHVETLREIRICKIVPDQSAETEQKPDR